MKKLFLLCQVILASILLSVNFFTVSADTCDTIYYISDSRYVSVSTSIVNNFSNYCFIKYSVSDMNQLISNGECDELLDGSMTSADVHTNSTCMPTGQNMNCQVVLEFEFLLPDYNGFDKILDKLKANGCSIIVIGSFSPYDYSSDEWNKLKSNMDYFYQKYPMSNFIGSTVNDMIYEHDNLNYSTIMIDRRFLGFDLNGENDFDPEKYSFQELYKYSYFLRCLVENLRIRYNSTISASDFLFQNNIIIIISTLNGEFYDITYDSQKNNSYVLSYNPFNVLDDDTFNSIYQEYNHFAISFYQYENNFGMLVDDMLSYADIEVYIIEIDQYPDSYNENGLVHIYEGDGDGILFIYYQLYGEFLNVNGEDENIWNLIQSLM